MNGPIKFNWAPNRNYCLTMKHSLDFECEEADKDFIKFARQKQGSAVIGYYKSKTAKALQKAYENCPYGHYLFLWDREGNCVDGAY